MPSPFLLAPTNVRHYSYRCRTVRVGQATRQYYPQSSPPLHWPAVAPRQQGRAGPRSRSRSGWSDGFSHPHPPLVQLQLAPPSSSNT